jgi:hypothetical protein
MKAIAICTIIAKNYLALAKALGQSLHRFHPDPDFRIAVFDLAYDCLDPAESGLREDNKFLIDSPVKFIEMGLLNAIAYYLILGRSSKGCNSIV